MASGDITTQGNYSFIELPNGLYERYINPPVTAPSDGSYYGAKDGEWVDIAGLSTDTNIANADLTSSESRESTFDYYLGLLGGGQKLISAETSGTVFSRLYLTILNAILFASDGTDSSYFIANRDGSIVIQSSTGEYSLIVAPTLDSDGTTTLIGGVSSGGGGIALKSIDNARFEILSGASAPVNGTTKAWYVGQLYVETTTPAIYRVDTASTDPDSSATGSVFSLLSLGGGGGDYNIDGGTANSVYTAPQSIDGGGA